MKLIKTYNTIVAVLFALVLFSACQRTELCYDHYPKASVLFTWEQEWERDYGKEHKLNWDIDYYSCEYDELRPETPEWINMVRYRNDNSEGEHYFSPNGGDVVLAEKGDYSFLFYNGDTEYLVFSDMASLSEVRASATPRSRSSLSYITERHPIAKSANPPDVLYAAFEEDIPTIGVHQTVPLSVKMQPLVYTYVIRYEFEHGAEHIGLARGALAGMAESVYLRNGRTSDDPIIILYDCEITDYGCEARVRSFGIPGFPDEYYGRGDEDGDVPERLYTLNLEVMLTNGKVLEFNFDIADQIKDQPRGGVIVVKGIRIEDEQNSTEMSPGGFDVDLSGWGEVDVDLPLPDL